MLGGAEGQAKVKEMLIPFVVGCVIVFGGFGFWKLAITFGEKLEGSSSSVAPGGGGSSSGNEGNSGGDNHYDFSERACKSCGQVMVPRYDEYKHMYAQNVENHQMFQQITIMISQKEHVELVVRL